MFLFTTHSEREYSLLVRFGFISLPKLLLVFVICSHLLPILKEKTLFSLSWGFCVLEYAFSGYFGNTLYLFSVNHSLPQWIKKSWSWTLLTSFWFSESLETMSIQKFLLYFTSPPHFRYFTSRMLYWCMLSCANTLNPQCDLTGALHAETIR